MVYVKGGVLNHGPHVKGGVRWMKSTMVYVQGRVLKENCLGQHVKGGDFLQETDHGQQVKGKDGNLPWSMCRAEFCRKPIMINVGWMESWKQLMVTMRRVTAKGRVCLERNITIIYM